MARIRTIKPEFFTSENIVAMSALARLLYIALWCEADKEGRFEWKPKTFKMRYFPADNCDINTLCDELLREKVVVLYGDNLAYIPQFSKHQHVNPRETASSLPEPTEELTRQARVVTRESTATYAQVGREGKGRERKEGKEHIPDAAFAAPASKSPGSLAFDEFDDAYRTRYGNSYTRNAKVNRHFSDLCKRLGSEEAPKVARWYVESENLPEFIKASHDPALLLMRCESIRTRMLQNRPMTTREAVDIDRRSGDEITIRNAVDKAQGLTRLPIQAEYQRLPEAIL